MEEIGNRLKAERTSQGLSQEDLASLAGVSALTIIRIEKGSSKPRMDTVRRLATALSVPEESLAYGTNEAKENVPGLDFYQSYQFAAQMEKEARTMVERLRELSTVETLPARQRAKISRELEKFDKVHRRWQDLKARHPQDQR